MNLVCELAVVYMRDWSSLEAAILDSESDRSSLAATDCPWSYWFSLEAIGRLGMPSAVSDGSNSSSLRGNGRLWK